MTTPLKNPWANVKADASKIVPPVAFLREQANLLTASTDGIVQGSVESIQSGDSMRHNLSASVPALDNYTVVLLYATHGQMLYPTFIDRPSRNAPTVKCDDQAQLEAAVVDLLSEKDPQRIVASLIAQATSP